MSSFPRGPLLIVNRDEAVRIFELVRTCSSDDVHAMSLLAKCESMLNADPAWRTPLK